MFCLQQSFCFKRLLLRDAVWLGVRRWRHSWHCVGSMISLNVLFIKYDIGVKYGYRFLEGVHITYLWNPLAVTSSRTRDMTSLTVNFEVTVYISTVRNLWNEIWKFIIYGFRQQGIQTAHFSNWHWVIITFYRSRGVTHRDVPIDLLYFHSHNS